MDWNGLFAFTVSPLELIIRGSAVYWFLFLVFRIAMRRNVGAMGVADILVLVLIADASQNAMAGEYRSITDGFVLVGTIVGWNYLIDWAAYHSDRLAKLLEAPPLMLVRRGQILHRNLRSELISVDELMSKLRERGVENLQQVKTAYLESGGEVSVILFDSPAALRPPVSRPEVP